MAISKELHKFSVAESLNTKTASGWTEASRGSTSTDLGSGANLEANIAIPAGHTQLQIYCEELCAIIFNAASGASITANSLQIEKEVTHEFAIPNGSTYVHVKGLEGADANKFCYTVTK